VSIPVKGVGFAADGTVAGNAKERAVLLRAGSLRFLGVGEPSEVRAVSRSGNVVGTIGEMGSVRGFVRMRDGALHALPAGFTPVAVNDAGEVAGLHYPDEGRRRAAVWRAGEALVLIPEPDEMPFEPAGINDRGEVVASHPAAGVWSRRGMRRLPKTLRGGEIDWHSSVGINNRGEILANGYDYRDGATPFIWSGGAARTLPNPRPTGSYGTAHAAAMNDHGEVVGWFTVHDEDGVPERFAVLWGRRGVRLLQGVPGTRSCVASAIDGAGTVLGVCEFGAGWRIGERPVPTEVPVVWENGVARLLCGGGAPPRGREHPCDPATYAAGPPPAVFVARIHPALPRYRFEFVVEYGVPVGVSAGPRDGSREPQYFELEDGTSTGTPIQLQDLNFDGYQDLSVVTMGGVHNESFNYYLFNPATGAFDFFRADNQLVPVRARRELTQYIHVSCCAGELRTFRWVDDKLVMVRNEVWEPWSRDQSRTLRAVSEWRNKRMVEVSRRVEPAKPEPR
jgi:hypothetical protein